MCDYIYQNIDDLNIHIQSVHVTHSEKYIYEKDPALILTGYVHEDSTQDDHQYNSPATCKECHKVFETTSQLTNHLSFIHPQDVLPPHQCDLTLGSSVVSPAIPQFDGNETIDSLDTTTNTYWSAIQPASVRNAPYTLNKEKQLSRLAKNATIPNFGSPG